MHSPKPPLHHRRAIPFACAPPLQLPPFRPQHLQPLRATQEKGVAKLAAHLMLRILAFYRVNITSALPPNCRFVPSCSAYMVEAIETHGATRGFLLSAWRLIRCNPTGGSGYDPVVWPPVAYNAGT